MSDVETASVESEDTGTVIEFPTNEEVEAVQAEEEKPKAAAKKATPRKTRSRAKAVGATRDSKEKKVATTKTRKTTAKKATAKKAASKKATGIGREEGSRKGGLAKPPADARERGALELDVKAIVEKAESGKLDLNGHALTPHRIATLIVQEDGLDRKPSTGAITNVLRRWEDYGYALLDEKPLAFRRLSAAGTKQGLDALRTKYRDKKKAERAAAKGK